MSDPFPLPTPPHPCRPMHSQRNNMCVGWLVCLCDIHSVETKNGEHAGNSGTRFWVSVERGETRSGSLLSTPSASFRHFLLSLGQIPSSPAPSLQCCSVGICARRALALRLPSHSSHNTCHKHPGRFQISLAFTLSLGLTQPRRVNAWSPLPTWCNKSTSVCVGRDRQSYPFFLSCVDVNRAW